MSLVVSGFYLIQVPSIDDKPKNYIIYSHIGNTNIPRLLPSQKHLRI